MTAVILFILREIKGRKMYMCYLNTLAKHISLVMAYLLASKTTRQLTILTMKMSGLEFQ